MPREKAPLRFVASGPDELAALSNVVLGVVGAVVLTFGVVRWAGLLPPLILGALGLLLLAGERYRLTISDDGIELRLFHAWVVPGRRFHYPLDAEVQLYQSWDADQPEGLCVTPAIGSTDKESDCFGPTLRRRLLRPIVDDARRALDEARAAMSGPVGPTRFATVPELASAIDPSSIQRWPASGRIRSATLARTFEIGGVTLGAGSVIECNRERWIDPRKPDQLCRARLAAPSPTPLRGLHAAAGAVVHFDADGRPCAVDRAGTTPLPRGRLHLDCADSIAWNRRGEPTRFRLAAPLPMDALTLPAGSIVWESIEPSGWDREWPNWYVRIASEVTLPDLKLPAGQALYVTHGFERVVAFSTDRDVEVRGETVIGGVMRIPLDGELRVDLRACRKSGLLRPLLHRRRGS